ncbi:unnamed protein product [Urochloa decumbens]|uniref:Phosphatidylinositol-specific phospholipase C X domain-containing protein n=1 Tax=Urochloa decumbens TaxID=240449 RepID=A0ABC9FEK5_9POAL
MGAFFSKQVDRRKLVNTEKRALSTRLSSSGDSFPGSDYHPADRKRWMAELGADRVRVHQVVWPGTHDSATDKIGVPLVTHPFAQCQSMSVYEQLCTGTRVIDVRVQKERRVCHGILPSYPVDVVLDDVKRFLGETESEVIVLELRTEFGHEDPPEFAKFLVDKLGEENLVLQDEAVFHKTIAELLPRRVICVWKPRKSPGNWIDTDLPETKFESNLKFLGQQPPVADRRFFYRVENTVTPQADNPVLCVWPVTKRIHGYAHLFIAEAFAKGLGDKLQVFSTDFIDGDFVDACAGVTQARVEGTA